MLGILLKFRIEDWRINLVSRRLCGVYIFSGFCRVQISVGFLWDFCGVWVGGVCVRFVRKMRDVCGVLFAMYILAYGNMGKRGKERVCRYV